MATRSSSGAFQGTLQDTSTGKSAISAARAAGMKGRSSREERSETTGGRLPSGSTCRGQGGCSAADPTILRPVGFQGNSELGRPVAPGEEADSSRLQGIRGDQTMESGGVGFFRPGGLIQDPAQLQLVEQQQGKRQQMVLDGCGGEGSGIREAEEECCGEEDEHSRNGGAAACAAAKEGSRKQRLPVVAAFSRKGRPGGADSSSEQSEDAGLDGGAAACAAAMDDAMLSEILLEAGVCWFECSAGDVRGWMES